MTFTLAERIAATGIWYVVSGSIIAGMTMLPGVLVDRRTGRNRPQTWPFVAVIVALWPAFVAAWTLSGFRDR